MGQTMAEYLMEQGAARAAVRVRREMLLLQLREKFKRVPQGVVKRVESTESVEQLNTWLRACATANKLSDVGIPPLR
jgi:hypothetical protein